MKQIPFKGSCYILFQKFVTELVSECNFDLWMSKRDFVLGILALQSVNPIYYQILTFITIHILTISLPMALYDFLVESSKGRSFWHLFAPQPPLPLTFRCLTLDDNKENGIILCFAFFCVCGVCVWGVSVNIILYTVWCKCGFKLRIWI